MSAPIAALRALVAGRSPEADTWLPNVRLEGLGGEAFGPEPVRAAFRRAQMHLPADADTVVSASTLAIIGETVAVVADPYDGRLGRLWCVGGPAVLVPIAGVSVPFDPDLDQRRGRGGFRADDHIDLSAVHAASVVDLQRDLLESVEAGIRTFRVRAFARRAFSSAERGAILWAVTLWHDDPARAIRTVNAVTVFRTSAGRLVHWRHVLDAVEGSSAPWRPRV